MNEKMKISIIGGTGNLGLPVVKFLLKSGFEIKLIVRNIHKAKQLFKPDAMLQLIEADLKNVSELKTALEDTEYLYLSLSTQTTDLNIPFSAEREGIANILEAINKAKIRQIIAISGLGAFNNVQKNGSFEFAPNIIRKQGHKLLKNSGIPYTILHCSWFADSFAIFRRKNVYSVIGDTKSPIYFTNCHDYSNHLIHAIANEEAFYKEFPIQGKEGLAHPEAARRFFDIFSMNTKITELPGGIIRILALFSKEMKFVKHMNDYFSASTEEFIAEEYNTYKILGEPKLSITDYAQLLKEEGIYDFLKKLVKS
ncbi:MAG: SDR family oxidoreductase [Bacteroidales bacterium]|nr:SDR family oxidoreductase [Bacteroidales bacterium]